MDNNMLAPAVADVRTEIPKVQHEGEYFVFYPGDRISGFQKTAVPYLQFGGVVSKNLCLQYRLGYLRRCEITQLMSHMDGVPIFNVHPGEQKHLPGVYTLVDSSGQKRLLGVTKTADGNEHDGLLRFETHPAMVIDRLVRDTEDNECRGLVRMPVKSSEEALLAQKFLFPEWRDIFIGKTPLPATNRLLRQYFMQRQAEANGNFEKEVADAAILACDRYQNWCDFKAAAVNAELNFMEKKGFAWYPGSDGEAAFRDSTVARRDMVQQSQATQMQDLTEAVSIIAKSMTQQPVSPETKDSKLYQEFQEFLEWKERQKNNEATGTADFGQCQAVTNAGEQCKQAATENGFCRLPQHQAKFAATA